MFHIFLHFAVPALAAFVFCKKTFLKSWLIMCAAMMADLDHLLADPIYDPNRCSIGFHPLHTGYAIAFYVVLAAFKKTRLAAAGLLIHMALDFIDCYC